MHSLLQDIQYAIRQLRRSPGFTITALLTLALGLGVTAAVYSVVQTVLLEPLPYDHPETLVGVAFTWPHQRPNAEQTGPSFEFVRDHTQAFSSVALMDDSGPAVNLSVAGGHPMQVTSLGVTEDYFRTLGVMPTLGRPFLPEEDRPGGPRSVIVSYGLWTRLLNRNPAILGQTIHINQDSYTVVGVMPAKFVASTESAPGVMATPDLWKPLQLGPKDPGYDGDNYEMIARLKPGVSLTQVQQQLDALVVPFYQLYPGYKQWRNGAKSLHEFRVWKLQDVVISDVRRSLLTLFGAVLAILLVACLNLAGLMAARAMRRSREIALRSALGASAAQLLRLIVCEGLLLALGGGALAMGVAAVTSKLLLHNTPLAIPGLYAEPDPWKLGLIVILVSLISTALFSTLPASMFLRRSSREMRLGSQSVGQVASHTQISRALMVLQMALAMVLISTASMLLGTFVKLQSIPSGVDPKHLTIFQVTLKGSRYSGSRSTERFVSTVIDELSQSPGVERVAAIHGLPMDSGLNDQGYPAGRKEMETTLEFRPVTSGYFAAMGIPLIMGRDISDSDRADTEPVVVIGETTAKKWWPGRSPIGESIHYGDKRDRRIVGVVADVHTHSLVESEGLLVYAPMTQVSDELTSALNGWFPISFALRTSAHLDTGGVIRQAVEQADPGIPVAKISTMQSVIDDTIQEPRFFSVLAVAFSLFAVGLTVIGLFGLLSYQVTQRTREIGVRMALGADRNMILRAFLGRGLLVSIFGIVTGSAASWTIRPVVANLLADSGLDVTTGTQHLMISSVQASMVSVVAILLAAAAASWLPASRAASVEPMQALRAE